MSMARTLPARMISVCLLAVFFPFVIWGAESGNSESGQITLRKSIGERVYKGKTVEGEERRIAPGDSLWHILIQEKGLSSNRFGDYIVVIRGLNPQLAPNGALRVGDTVFIPLRPDEALQAQNASPPPRMAVIPGQGGRGATEEYRIKAGEHLYQILRERLGIMNEQQLAVYYALVKDLNPQKKNWDLLIEGETIRLPVLGNPAEARAAASRPTVESKPRPGPVPPPLAEKARPGAVANAPNARSSEPESPAQMVGGENAKSGPDRDRIPLPEPVKSNAGTEAGSARHPEFKAPEQIAARENLALVAQVVEALGNEVQRDGEEVLPVKEGVVRVQKRSFPLVYNRSLDQRVILDPEDKIPSAVRSKLSQQENTTTVFSLSKNMSVKEAVTELLSRLGYQSLSADQAMVVQEGGLAFEAKGDWIVLAPEVSRKRQEVFIINIGDGDDNIPDYLQSQLALSGVHFKNISLASTVTAASVPPIRESKVLLAQSKAWPRDKKEIVDALLFAYGIPFGVSEVLPVELGQGLKLDTSCDRLFELRGQRTALFFRRIEPEIKQALEEKLTVKVVELDLTTLSSRELIGKLLSEVGEQATYKEHRFNVATGAKHDNLVIDAWGFLVSKPAMFVTDRRIPKGYERFFFEKGLDIVYFQ